jgi:hypothetical protein
LYPLQRASNSNPLCPLRRAEHRDRTRLEIHMHARTTPAHMLTPARGTCSSGHYTAYIANVEGKIKGQTSWMFVSDMDVRYTDPPQYHPPARTQRHAALESARASRVCLCMWVALLAPMTRNI